MKTLLLWPLILWRRWRLACRIRARLGPAAYGIPDAILLSREYVAELYRRRDQGFEPSSDEIDIMQSSKQRLLIWEWEGE